MEYHMIDIRSPRRYGGYSSSDDYYDDYYDDDDHYWPIYLYVILSFLIFMTSLFFWSLVFYCVKENRRKKQGQQFRMGHVIWSAFKIASFLWIPIGIYHCCCSSKRHKNNNAAGNYAQINEYQGAAGAAHNNGWYGAPAPAAAAYGAGGMGYATPGKFEPMGYAGAAGMSIPLAPMNVPQQTGIPVGAAAAPPAPQMVPMATGYVSHPGTPAPPPPYTGPPQPAPAPAPAPVQQTVAPPTGGGAAQGYYAASTAPAPVSYPPQATVYAPAQSTPPATITFPPPTSYAPATQQQTGYMSATYVPQQNTNSPYYGQ